MLAYGEWIEEQIPAPVPHRQYVFALPKLVRLLDWLVVADHAESLGVAVLIERSDPAILASDIGRQTHDLYKKGDIYGAFETWGFNVIVNGNNPLTDVTDIKIDSSSHNVAKT